MTAITVVGSGASGVHFALTALERGHRVTLVDVGRAGEAPPRPELPVGELKEQLADPVEYFVGSGYESLVLPDEEAEYYGLPPGKRFAVEEPAAVDAAARGFSPLFSYARGGFGEVWTAGCYPFSDRELEAFPFGWAELGPRYETVARRIGVTGAADDLASFLPLHGHLLEPLDLDEHSRRLVERYRRRRELLQDELGFYLGRTRVATLSRDLGERRACSYLGRCLWGCPNEALYTPSLTLRECERHPRFTYRGGLRARHFEVGPDGRANTLVAEPARGGGIVSLPVENLVLAAGTLGSARIFLRSVWEATGELVSLRGLMDNLQALVPFVHLAMIGRQYREASYQYHLLGLGLTDRDASGYVHGQITTLKAGVLHPIVQSLPLDLATAAFVTRQMRAALGVVNLNFEDRRRPDNRVVLEPREGGEPRLLIEYRSRAQPAAVVRRTLGRLRSALRILGCVVPPGMTHVRPLGASVHYAGTLPMSRTPAPWTTDATGCSRDFPNVWLADGSTFPALPAKNLTFTLMANAVRIAEEAF